jgi:hypothetical protein
MAKPAKEPRKRGSGNEKTPKATGAEKYPPVSADTKWHRWVSGLYAPEKKGSICRILSNDTIAGPGYVLVDFGGGERLIGPREALVRLKCPQKNQTS